MASTFRRSGTSAGERLLWLCTWQGDGTRLFIADGGNDRVLVYNSIPTQNAAKADVVLGEPDEFSDVFTNANPVVLSSSDITPTPVATERDWKRSWTACGPTWWCST